MARRLTTRMLEAISAVGELAEVRMAKCSDCGRSSGRRRCYICHDTVCIDCSRLVTHYGRQVCACEVCCEINADQIAPLIREEKD